MDKPALLLTRPRESAEAFLAELDRGVLDGVRIVVSPLIEIRPLEVRVDMTPYAGVIFTSANGVGFAEDGARRPAFCVGTKTAEAARDRGWRVERIAQDADALVGSLLQDPVEAPLLHIAGAHRRGQVAERLSDAGLAVDVVAIYEQTLVPLSDEAQALLARRECVVVPLFSPRTAAQFARDAGDTTEVTFVAMSEAVAEPLQKLPAHSLHIARAPTAEDMRHLIEMLLRQDSLA